MVTRFRAEQLGSLLRPPELLAARCTWAAGQMTIEDLRPIGLDTLPILSGGGR